METEEITLKYPAGFEYAVHMTKAELEKHLRLMAALKMFELGKISSGKAAQLAGMSRVEFLETCGMYRVSIFNYPEEELEKELQAELAFAKGKEDDADLGYRPADRPSKDRNNRR